MPVLTLSQYHHIDEPNEIASWHVSGAWDKESVGERPGIFMWSDDNKSEGHYKHGSGTDYYHHVILDDVHKWGDHFGISGSQRDDYALPAHCYGVFLEHPTLSQDPYDATGSCH